MTELAEPSRISLAGDKFAPAGIRKRYAAERRFKMYGVIAVSTAVLALAVLVITIVGKGYGAFRSTEVLLDIYLDAEVIDPTGAGDVDQIRRADFAGLVKKAMYAAFPDVTDRRGKRALVKLVSFGADLNVRQVVLDDISLIGTTQPIWIAASSDIDMFSKGAIARDVPESDRRVSDQQIGWFDVLDGDDRIRTVFNTRLFSNGDSREPELAGVLGAMVGSFWTMLVCLLFAVPVAVMAALYLEEFAPRNRLTRLIEVNINNLAAVPSIVFGLLGLAVFLNVFGLPRSAPLVGGMVLALMTMPTVIIAGRAALKSVPPSIRDAALGVGASRMQVVTHHVLPLAMPGILTGTIIGLAGALGETAPLLMIGMVAFIVDVPGGPLDPATVLPVQIYLWSDSPERGFIEKSSAAIMVLMAFLVIMNAAAVYLRNKFERRW